MPGIRRGDMASTLFESYGGFATVRKIVSTFYDKVLDSQALQKHFVDVDMRALIDHQTKFVAMVMGGPASFSDDQLRRVHARLGITPSEFEEMAALLQETLEDFDFAPSDVAHVLREIRRRQSLIVTRSV
jgi:hemoglobin